MTNVIGTFNVMGASSESTLGFAFSAKEFSPKYTWKDIIL